MLFRILRFISTSTSKIPTYHPGSVELQIASATTNTFLFTLAKSCQLSPSELSLFLSKIHNNISKTYQFNATFFHQDGLDFLKSTVYKYRQLSLEDKVNLLGILSSATSKHRNRVCTQSFERTLCLNVAEAINPSQHPELLINAYKSSALILRGNFNFDLKIERLIKSEFRFSIKMLVDVIKGLNALYKPGSWKLVELLLKKMRECGIENEEPEELVRIFQELSRVELIYSLGEDLMAQCRKVLIGKANLLKIEDVARITKVYVENHRINKDLLYAALTQFSGKKISSIQFWGDNFQEIFKNLMFIHKLDHDFVLNHQVAETLLRNFFQFRSKNLIDDIELVSLIHSLSFFLKSIPSFIQSDWLEKLNTKANKDLICFALSILLSRFNNPAMIEKVIHYSTHFAQLNDLAIDTYTLLYILILSANLHKTHKPVRDFMNYIEINISHRIKDFNSVRAFMAVFFNDSFELVNTNLWVKASKKTIKVLSELYKLNQVDEIFIMSEMVNLKTSTNELRDEWGKFFSEIKHRINETQVNVVLCRNLKEHSLNALLDLLTFYGRPNHFGLAICLSMKVESPTNRLLKTALGLLKSPDVLKQGDLRISEASLLSQIFNKGYSGELSEFFNKIDYLGIAKKNESVARQVLKWAAQYKMLKARQVYSLIQHHSEWINSDASTLISVSTVNPTLLKNSPNALTAFFQITSDLDLYQVLDKTNLYTSFYSPLKPRDFFESLQKYLSGLKSSPALLISFIQGLSAPNSLSSIIDELVRYLASTESPNSDLLSSLLLSLLRHSYNQHSIGILEDLKPSPQSSDVLEHLILAYQHKNRQNQYRDHLFAIGLNILDESTFLSLVSKSRSKH